MKLAPFQKPPLGSKLNFGHPLARGFAGAWVFNEGSGSDVRDHSGNERHGTIVGVAAQSPTSGWVLDAYGTALQLDGSNDYVNCVTSPALNLISEWTYVIWFRRNYIGTHQDPLISHWLSSTAQRQIYIYFSNSTNVNKVTVDIPYVKAIGVSNATIADRKLHQVIVTRQGSNWIIYIDGVLDKLISDATTQESVTTAPFLIGGLTYSGNYFRGNIYSSLAYNRAISGKEVGNLYSLPYCMFEEPYCLNWMVGTQTINLTTTIAATSTVSAPIAAITRPLISASAVVSAVAAPILAITRALQASVAAGSATSTPSLLILRALISAISGVSDVGIPNLAVERSLSSSLDAISAVSTPSLAVQRALALLAAVMSETPDIELLLHGILDITTAVAAQSQVSSPALNVARPLDSSVAAQTQTSAAVLTILRALASTIASEAQTPEITLKVLRDLAMAISAQSAVSTPGLESICSLITEAHAVTDTSAGVLAVLRDLVATIAVQSALSEFDLAMGVPLDLITLVAALTQTSDIEVLLAFHESLLVKAKRYYGPVSAVGLKAAALQWVETEEEKEANLPGDQYNDHVF